MTAANDNRRELSVEERQDFIDRFLEELDLLCLGLPSAERLDRAMAMAGVR